MSYFLILASYFFYIRAYFICQAELVLIYGAVLANVQPDDPLVLICRCFLYHIPQTTTCVVNL